MSKYDDLLQIHTDEHQRHLAYKNECLVFAEWLFEGFSNYIECPQDCISFVASWDEINDPESRGRSPRNHMRVSDDGDLETHLLLKLCPESPPSVRDILQPTEFCINIRVGKTDEDYTVRIGNEEMFKLAREDTSKAEEFFESILDLIKKRLRESFRDQSVLQRIGFV